MCRANFSSRSRRVAGNPIVSTVPFDENGKFHGFLRLPYSRDDSAWGAIMIPLCVVQNGVGPTALLTGANHGDEYEGPIALQDLAHSLQPEDITGRVIIVPAFNYPAFKSGRRVSPIDGRNLNRIFPGRPDGTVSEKIADYFARTLVPMADLVVDFHSGGKTLDFVPFACSHVLDNKNQQAACTAAVAAFNAPYTLTLLEIDNVGMYDTEVEGQGKVFVTTELGGGGTATARTAGIAKRGVRNVLKHAGILAGEPERGPSVVLDMPDSDCFVVSEDHGLIEAMVDLGEEVQAGDVVARIWSSERTGQAPVECRAARSGVLISRHFPGLVQAGDCVAVVGVREE
ncbi:N(2)-acetyl-L-2,4-diaminobutanoate deacetylase DoeB [Pseudohoeflea coraliihabitans]|uniref:N(2)-acetyl-L-2,4-diaminobutanoate deacetylase DoeB n=1 Tax=Pseudohoeflea coraliihabitans TaxID=2860393 RepID=A0ABS6WM52_9HYPH|nr:N(2)-acetyl-L-2,4-diaminobutanoate deacetylase DoeB [Pseudohoeflea sp. DP4N28-3]MBW3096195.1 N(2)-acetyl-L-2,4-diaminobutanoate deacetylase DoeB [Pseudohoeflea sp. DP4N28-3]